MYGLVWLSPLISFSCWSPSLFNGMSWMVILPVNIENEWRIRFFPKPVRAIKRVSLFLNIRRRTVWICSECGDRSVPGFIFWSIRFRHVSITEYWLGTSLSLVNWFIRYDMSFRLIDGTLDSVNDRAVDNILSFLFLGVYLLRCLAHFFRLFVLFRLFARVLLMQRIRLV